MARNQALTAREIDELPDSSFAVVLPGRRDAQGKTTPRSLRKFPYRNAQGGLLLDHAENAISTLNGPRGTVAGSKTQRVAAWEKVVAAIRQVRSNYVPPPRKF